MPSPKNGKTFQRVIIIQLYNITYGSVALQLARAGGLKIRVFVGAFDSEPPKPPILLDFHVKL